jgi:hypothetical protein
MMRDLDRMIDEALGAEESELLRSIEEPGYIQQALGVFSGRTGWVNAVLMIFQGIAFIAGAWAAWNFFQMDEPVAQLRWGLPAAVLLLLAAIVKMAVLPRIETNRVILELKRIELQIARSRGA